MRLKPLRAQRELRQAKTPFSNLSDRVQMRAVSELLPYPKNPRKHSDAQIAMLMNSVSEFWTNPILIDETMTVLSGHGRLIAAQRLKMPEVPTIMLIGLSDAQKRACVIAENRLAEKSEWDHEFLVEHLEVLSQVEFEISQTGFTTGEVDIFLERGNPKPGKPNADDEIDPINWDEPPISRIGDLWVVGRHRLLCGDSRQAESFRLVMERAPAQLVVTDSPYNVRISGHARGRTKKQHREFEMASGEMSDREFQSFLSLVIEQIVNCSANGSIAYFFIDWRHLLTLVNAATPFYTEWKNLLVWRKSNAGLGTFYRSQHELIAVFKAGNEPHINNFGLGESGRYRTNVLDYPGGSTFSQVRQDELEMHPTVKPVALVADLIRDCSDRNGVILDAFGGSGTTIIAAERAGRQARLIEIDPRYVDLTIRRWEKLTGEVARHSESGRSFKNETMHRPERLAIARTPGPQSSTPRRARR